VILVEQPGLGDDPSPATNARIVSERIAAPVLRFPHLTAAQLDDDAALTAAAHDSGLLAQVLPLIHTR
jgi:hypothetical protein